jgi:nucleoside-diphosphate-sugar epimerase
MSLTDWRKLHGNQFAGTSALVTGGAGFIGSHITEALLALGAKVTVLDDLSGGDEANLDGLPGKAKFLKGSILDKALVAEAVKGCAFVFHQAALGSVPRSVEKPELYNEVNTTGTLNVLEAARRAGVNRVMFAASSSAYGDSEVLPKIESMVPAPRSPYAANKVAGEALMQAYSASYGIDSAALRYFNIFGPRQNANSAYAAVIAAFAKALFAGERPVIFGDGEQSRDFTYVENAVHANLLAARSTKNIEGKAINVACGQRITVNELAKQMAQMIGRPDLTPIYKPDRAGDVKHSLADMTRARDLLGYDVAVTFSAGLAVTVDWYKTVMV